MCCAMCTHGINLGVKKRNQPGWIVAPNVITVLTATSGPPVRCGAVRCGRRRSSDLDGHHNQTGHPPSRPPRWRPRARPRPLRRPRLKAPATRARGRVGLLAVPAAGGRGGLWSELAGELPSQAGLQARAGAPDPSRGTCKSPSGSHRRDCNKHPLPSASKSVRGRVCAGQSGPGIIWASAHSGSGVLIVFS